MTRRDASRSSVESGRPERDEWVAEVQSLADDVERWAQARNWAVRRDSKRFEEDAIGAYEAPVLTVLTSLGRVVFEPVARYVMGGLGRIDLYAFPSFAQVVLVRRETGWRFLADADFSDLGRVWSEEDFIKTVAELQATT